MKRSPAALPARASLLALAALSALLGACTSTGDGLLSGDKVDYRSAAAAAKPKPLEVPPDLTQLTRDTRYQTQGGVVSAAAGPGGAASVPGSGNAGAIAPLVRGEVRVERDGNTRWLVVPMPPEQLWPLLKGFWEERGFKIASESPEAGVIETDWAENRAKLPQDIVRSTLGRLIDGLYDTGERDRFRTRVERTATGSEVYITHRGMEEVFSGDRNETTVWRPRPSDPQLEAELLSRLLVKLGPQQEAAVARAAVGNAPELPARARVVPGSTAALELDEPFDRAWRRVGLALDRSGFTVEDRDRTAGLYFVRYIDPKNIGKEEPGFWAKLMGNDTKVGAERYRVTVKNSGTKTLVSVLTSAGDSAAGDAGQRIVGRLVNELR